MITQFIISSILLFLALCAIDWAFFDRTLNVIIQFFPLKKDYKYFNFFNYRYIGIIFSALIISHEIVFKKHIVFSIILGSFMFIVSNFYIYFRIYVENRNKN